VELRGRYQEQRPRQAMPQGQQSAGEEASRWEENSRKDRMSLRGRPAVSSFAEGSVKVRKEECLLFDHMVVVLRTNQQSDYKERKKKMLADKCMRPGNTKVMSSKLWKSQKSPIYGIHR
jgi:hypothetical protein